MSQSGTDGIRAGVRAKVGRSATKGCYPGPGHGGDRGPQTANTWPDHERKTPMNLTIRQRSAVIALGVGGALSMGAAAALAANTHTDAPAHMSMSSAATDVSPGPGVQPATPTPSPTTTSTAAPQPAHAARQLSVAQAVDLARRQTHATPEKVEMKVSATGVDYEVKLTRADGSDLKVFVLGSTGRVLSEAQQEQLELAHPEPAETPEPAEPSQPDVETH